MPTAVICLSCRYVFPAPPGGNGATCPACGADAVALDAIFPAEQGTWTDRTTGLPLAFIPCPHCRRPVPEVCRICPHCEEPLRDPNENASFRRPLWGQTVLAVLGGIFLVGLSALALGGLLGGSDEQRALAALYLVLGGGAFAFLVLVRRELRGRREVACGEETPVVVEVLASLGCLALALAALTVFLGVVCLGAAVRR